MAKSGLESIDDYIASQPEGAQRVLRRVRTILRRALPKTAVEGISYQIPTYKLDGRAVVYFAGWKTHYALYPLGEYVTETLAQELSAYEVAKGTVRFPYAERVPTHLIQRIAKLRVESSRLERAARKKPKSSKSITKKAPAKKSRAKAATRQHAKGAKRRDT